MDFNWGGDNGNGGKPPKGVFAGALLLDDTSKAEPVFPGRPMMMVGKRTPANQNCVSDKLPKCVMH